MSIKLRILVLMTFDVYYGMYVYVKLLGKSIMYSAMETNDIIMPSITEIAKQFNPQHAINHNVPHNCEHFLARSQKDCSKFV